MVVRSKTFKINRPVQRQGRLSAFVAGACVVAFICSAPHPAFAAFDVVADEKILTKSLVARYADYRKAKGEEKERMEEQLKALAIQRKAVMLSKLQTDPKAFLKSCFPKQVHSLVPDDAKPFIEEHLEMTGELIIIPKETVSGAVIKPVYYLRSLSGSADLFRVHFSGPSPVLENGSKVKGKGVRLDAEFVLAEKIKVLESPSQAAEGNAPVADPQAVASSEKIETLQFAVHHFLNGCDRASGFLLFSRGSIFFKESIFNSRAGEEKLLGSKILFGYQ